MFRFLPPKNLVVGESWPPWFIFVIFPCWFQQIETDETASKSAEASSFDVDKLILYLKELIAEGLKSSEGMAFISFACQIILCPVSLHHSSVWTFCASIDFQASIDFRWSRDQSRSFIATRMRSSLFTLATQVTLPAPPFLILNMSMFFLYLLISSQMSYRCLRKNLRKTMILMGI